MSGMKNIENHWAYFAMNLEEFENPWILGVKQLCQSRGDGQPELRRSSATIWPKQAGEACLEPIQY